AVIQAERVDDRGPHAARRGRSDDDYAVAAKQSKVRGEVRPEEAGWLLLFDHDVARARRNHRDDLIAVETVMHRTARFVSARALPPPASTIPIVGTPLAGRVDDREPLGSRRFDQRFDVLESDPSRLAA